MRRLAPPHPLYSPLDIDLAILLLEGLLKRNLVDRVAVDTLRVRRVYRAPVLLQELMGALEGLQAELVLEEADWDLLVSGKEGRVSASAEEKRGGKQGICMVKGRGRVKQRTLS